MIPNYKFKIIHTYHHPTTIENNSLDIQNNRLHTTSNSNQTEKPTNCLRDGQQTSSLSLIMSEIID